MVQDRHLGSDFDAIEMLSENILFGTNCLTLSRLEFYIDVVEVLDRRAFRSTIVVADDDAHGTPSCARARIIVAHMLLDVFLDDFGLRDETLRIQTLQERRFSTVGSNQKVNSKNRQQYAGAE